MEIDSILMEGTLEVKVTLYLQEDKVSIISWLCLSHSIQSEVPLLVPQPTTGPLPRLGSTDSYWPNTILCSALLVGPTLPHMVSGTYPRFLPIIGFCIIGF
jgi:hypothetical protein